jgi:hypothetical protein
VHDGHIMEPSDPLHTLGTFRHSFYECLHRRADALFELTDALLTAGSIPSPPHLSLVPVHRRGWGSLYAALSMGRMDEGALRDLLSRHLLEDKDPAGPRIYAVDVSVWPRCDAEASPQRGYYYHPSRHSAGQPIVAGWAYQFVAQLGFERDSWVAPMDARRVKPVQDADEAATEQVRALVERLPEPEAVPIFVFDAGYDPVKLQRALEGCPAQILVRLHSNRVFYAEPEPSFPRPVGRPRRHGKKFDLKDFATWPEPTREHRCDSDDYGSVRVRCWSGLHPKTRRIGERYGCERAPIVQGSVILVEVSKLPRQTRKPKKLWLWWSGQSETNLDLIWRAYCHRFDLEHTIRFLKQTVGWTAPRFRHPEQADRWTWLVLAAYTQLRLARGIVADERLPWERLQRPRRLTPTRVLRSFATLLAVVGTPAKPPKPCGRSPGRPRGSCSGPAKRHPALKTAA